jgi:hypothetical protein
MMVIGWLLLGLIAEAIRYDNPSWRRAGWSSWHPLGGCRWRSAGRTARLSDWGWRYLQVVQRGTWLIPVAGAVLLLFLYDALTGHHRRRTRDPRGVR